MKKYEIKFNVSMNNDEKLAGNKRPVEMIVNADEATIDKYVIKAIKVWIQAQLRPNWTEFEAGNYPKEVTLGVPIFGNGRKSKEDYKTTLMNKPMVQRLKVLLDEGMIDVDMYEASIEKLFDRGEITEDEMTEALDI